MDDLLAFRGAVPFEEGEEPPEPEEIATTEVDYLGQAATDLSVERSFLEEIAALLDGQVVFYGPPGTGKTFVAKRLATALAEGEAAPTTIVQFHPASTYEGFFKGSDPLSPGVRCTTSSARDPWPGSRRQPAPIRITPTSW